MKKEKIKEPTKEQIQAWKVQFGEVHLIEVSEAPIEPEANTLVQDMDAMPTIKGYLRKPDGKVNNYAVATMPRSIVSAGKMVLKDCWLGGDERLLNDETYSATAAMQAVELVDVYQSRLKKL